LLYVQRSSKRHQNYEVHRLSRNLNISEMQQLNADFH